jgi:hypothetical protein
MGENTDCTHKENLIWCKTDPWVIVSAPDIILYLLPILNDKNAIFVKTTTYTEHAH